MERPTKTVKTPNDHEVVIKSWLTAGENQNLQRAFLSKAKTSFNKASARENPEEAINLDDMSADSMLDIQNKMIEVYVESIDGKTEDILKVALDLRSDDFEFIIVQINEGEKKA